MQRDKAFFLLIALEIKITTVLYMSWEKTEKKKTKSAVNSFDQLRQLVNSALGLPQTIILIVDVIVTIVD